MFKKVAKEDVEVLNKLKDDLWFALGFLRGSVKLDDYHLVLLLLSLHKDGYFDNLMLNEERDAKNEIAKAVKTFNGKTAEAYIEIFSVLEDRLRNYNSGLLIELLRLFKSLDQVYLDKYYSEVFDDLIYRYTRSQGKSGGEFIQPKEISKFICDLAALPSDAKVYNPFAGLASFGVFLDGDQLYVGQEYNSSTWAIGYLRILAYEREGITDFIKGDSIHEWNPNVDEVTGNPKKFDLIIANPPMGNRVKGEFGLMQSCEHFTIEKGIKDLTPEGKLIVVISLGFLFHSGAEQNLRHFLIHQDLIETIILLPGGILTNTSISFAILVINKKKKKKGIVSFVDAKNCVTRISTKEKILNEGLLMQVLRSQEDNESIRSVSNEEIVRNSYNLLVPRYFMKTYDGVQLLDLLNPVLKHTSHGGESGKFIQIRNLRVDKFNYTLDLFSFETVKINLLAQLIGESCLLIASVGGKLKPTYFNYTGESIYIDRNVYAFKVNEDIVDINYLINELYADGTKEQLAALVTGTVMPRLKREDFLSLKIRLPLKSEQIAKISGFKEEHIRNKEKELSLEREILGLKDEAFRDFASMKHTFRQYLNALKSNVSGTRKFISNNVDQDITLNSIYSANLNRTLGEHLLSLEGTVDSLSKLLTSFEEHTTISDAEEVDLKLLVEEAQNRFKDHDQFQFEELFFDIESFTQGDGGIIAPMVYVHPEDFYRLFSNIIANAIDHGFKGRANNIVRTSLSFDAENLFCVLEISNNGKPMEEEFTVNHLTTRGEKTTDSKGSGVGGADVKSILEKYNGTIELKKDKDAEFPVTYLIGLPLVITSI